MGKMRRFPSFPQLRSNHEVRHKSGRLAVMPEAKQIVLIEGKVAAYADHGTIRLGGRSDEVPRK